MKLRPGGRLGISELTGTLMMIGITLVAGAGVIGWVNGQTSTSENAYSNSAASGINYLREHFAPVTYTFGGCAGVPRLCTSAQFWAFNNGQVAFTLASLQIQTPTGALPGNFLNIIYTPTGYTAYNSAGVQLACNPSAPGFSGPASPVPAGTLTSTPYTVNIPSCGGVNNIVVGQGYVITMTGLYGNVVQFQLTANG